MSYKSNMRWAREQKEYSQKYVAYKLEVSAPTVSDWESGKKKPTADNLIRLSHLYDRSIDFLLGCCPRPSVDSLWNTEHMQKLMQGYSLHDVANALGVTDNYLQSIIDGQLTPTVDDIVRLSEYTKSSIDYLLNRIWEIDGADRTSLLSLDEKRLISAFQKLPIDKHSVIIAMVEAAANVVSEEISPATEAEEHAG